MANTDISPVELFKQKAVPVSIQVTEVKGLDEAMAHAIDVCEKKEFCELLLSGCGEALSEKGEEHCRRATAKTMAAPGLDDASYAKLEKMASAKGFTMLRAGMRDHLAGMDVTFTTADLAIADTATTVLNSNSEDLRIATMVCEVHVIALKKSQIVRSSEEAKEFLHKLMDHGPAYTAFISGPSRTADIERVLTLGVHGPLELHVALMEG